MFNQWCTIESDPGVFTQLVKQIGAPSVQVEQIYSMDDDPLITTIRPDLYGFIFLFKWTKDLEKRQSLSIYDDDLFFARQIVNNACATQAILGVLLNAPIKIEGNLKQFHQFTKDLTCEDRGLSLSNSQAIRKLHNSFSRPQPFIFKEDKKKKQKESDIYHFVSYVPHKGNLYELDGLQPGPILIGKYQKPDDWVILAKQQIYKRIQKYSEKQIRFNLLVVCQDLKNKSVKEIEKLRIEKARITKKQKILNQPYNEQYLSQFDAQLKQAQENDPETLNLQMLQANDKIAQKQAFVHEQELKAQERKQQNIRRKHNYVPLIVKVLKTLAKKNKLGELIQKTKKK